VFSGGKMGTSLMTSNWLTKINSTILSDLHKCEFAIVRQDNPTTDQLNVLKEEKKIIIGIDRDKVNVTDS
jgi:UPF0288 family protein (methanogenesis marker protein 3)